MERYSTRVDGHHGVDGEIVVVAERYSTRTDGHHGAGGPREDRSTGGTSVTTVVRREPGGPLRYGVGPFPYSAWGPTLGSW